MSEPLDFTFDPVREYGLSVMAETADQFDIDGIKMCFRDHAYFPAGSGPDRAYLMTDLVRTARRILDERGRAKGKHLVLSARVFATLKECVDLGLDAAAWIKEELIDYLSPQDTMLSDFGLLFEEFSELTRGSQCMLYPGMLPWTSTQARNRLSQIPLSSANCRALAKTHLLQFQILSVVPVRSYKIHCRLWHYIERPHGQPLSA